MELFDYVKWILAGIVAVMTIAEFVITLIKKVKEGEKPLEALDEAVTTITTVIEDDLPSLMVEAENLAVPGAMKKVYVLSQLAIRCTQRGINFNDVSVVLEDALEKYISFSKQVNSKK